MLLAACLSEYVSIPLTSVYTPLSEVLIVDESSMKIYEVVFSLIKMQMQSDKRSNYSSRVVNFYACPLKFIRY